MRLKELNEGLEDEMLGFYDSQRYKKTKQSINTLEYMGFIGGDYMYEKNGLITGEVINSDELITFQGFNNKELESSFIESIKSHLST